MENGENIPPFQIGQILANQISRKYFISPLAPINAGKIVKNTENIQGIQMRPGLANQGWEKKLSFHYYGPINAGKIGINTENILQLKIVGALAPFRSRVFCGCVMLCWTSHMHPKAAAWPQHPDRVGAYSHIMAGTNWLISQPNLNHIT